MLSKNGIGYCSLSGRVLVMLCLSASRVRAHACDAVSDQSLFVEKRTRKFSCEQVKQMSRCFKTYGNKFVADELSGDSGGEALGIGLHMHKLGWRLNGDH